MSENKKKGKKLINENNFNNKTTKTEQFNNSNELINQSFKKNKEQKENNDKLTKRVKPHKLTAKKRIINFVTRIDKDTSKLLNAMVALDIAPSRSSAAASLISEAIENNKEKYLKILESYDTLKDAKEKVKSNYYKTLKESNE